MVADIQGWTEDELWQGKHSTPPVSAVSTVRMSFAGADPPTARLPRWVADAQWQATPGRPPELPPASPVHEDQFRPVHLAA
jgi:hypothetical protein